MEQTPFELTPEQKGMLATLSRETGKPIPVLIAEALEELQEHVHRSRDRNGDAEMQQEAARTSSVLETFREARQPIAPAPEEPPKPFWKKALEASQRIPEAELDRLPTDLAAQVDHYIYGTPKR